MVAASTLPELGPPTIVCCFTSGFWVYRSVSIPSQGTRLKEIVPLYALRRPDLSSRSLMQALTPPSQSHVRDGDIRERTRNGDPPIPTDIPLRLSGGGEQGTPRDRPHHQQSTTTQDVTTEFQRTAFIMPRRCADCRV
jgi:hypothetical protein